MPLTKWQPPAARHQVDDDGRVTWLELFFDLVFVAGLIQLGDRLSADLTWRGATVFVGAFTLLWWIWTGTTAFTNRFAVDDITHRVLTFFQMFAVGSVAVLAATTPDGWRTWLPIAYVAARIPTLLMYARARNRVPEGRQSIDLFLRFFTAGSAMFLLSLLVPSSARPAVWALAIAMEFAAPVIGAARGYGPPLHDEHFEERYALFTIIVLGETFVKTLTELSEIGLSLTTQVLGAFGFFILLAVWWTYFDDVAGGHVRSKSPITKWAPGNRLIWTYAHLPLAAAITAFGVAAKKVVGVESLDAYLKTSYTWLLVIALIVVMVVVAVLDLVTVSPHYAIDTQGRVLPRVIAAVLLLPLGFVIASGAVSVLVGVILIAAVMVGQIAHEVVLAQKSELRLNRSVQEGIDRTAGLCRHLREAVPPSAERPPLSCPPCAEHGNDWVQLRWCLTCATVVCCDDSAGAHGRSHWEETGHPVIATIEPGDTWAYCWEHQASAPNWWNDYQTTE